MIDLPFWQNWVWWAYLFVWVPFAASAALYGLRSPWRHSAIGRAFMTLLGSLTAILSFVLVLLAVPLSTGLADWLRGVTLGGVGLAGYLLLRQIHILQNIAKAEPPCPRRRTTDIP